MKGIEFILVATDFSSAAQRAVLRAAQLGIEHQAPLEILHVMEALPPGEESRPETTATAVESRLAEVAAQLDRPGLSIRHRVEQGKDFVAIIQRARQMQANLVVIGAQGEHAPQNTFFGTTAQKLSRKGNTPLLVVKQPTQTPYRRTLVATDFSSASRQALEVAMQIAPQAEIDLLHVFWIWGESRLGMVGAGPQERSSYRRQIEDSAAVTLQEWLDKNDLGARHINLHVRQGHPATVITQLAQERQADLTVIGTTGRSGLPYILLGSVAEKVLCGATGDVLVVRPHGFRFELP